MATEIEKITAEIIAQNFNLEQAETDLVDFNRFRSLLIDKLGYLLDHDFEKLLWILYRIDVDEQLVKTTLAANPERPPAELMADLIIQRQMKKAETRLKHKRGEL